MKTFAHLVERTISQTQIFKGRFIDLWRDEIQGPQGVISTREYIRHPGAAVILPVLPDGKLILINQYRYPLKRSFLEFPAGKRDGDEDFLTTAHRELEEEVGYKAGKMEFLTTIYPVIGYADERMDLFLASDLHPGQKQLDHDENLESEIVSLEELMDRVLRGDVPDVKTQIGAFWLQDRRSRKIDT